MVCIRVSWEVCLTHRFPGSTPANTQVLSLSGARESPPCPSVWRFWCGWSQDHGGETEVPTGETRHSKPCSRATTHISGPDIRIKWDNRCERALESIQHSINTRRHYYFQAGTALWQKWLSTFSLNYHNHLFKALTKLITLSAAGMEEIPPETSRKKIFLLMWECAWVPAWSSIQSSLPFLLLVPSFLG